jgi:hypothetical protein
LEAAFKAYLMMKEGGIPQEVADILGLSNVSSLISLSSKVADILDLVI